MPFADATNPTTMEMLASGNGRSSLTRQRQQSQSQQHDEQYNNDERTRAQQPGYHRTTTASTNNVAHARGASAAASTSKLIEVDPLSNEEYRKLKQLGHFFPSQSPTYEDNNSDEADEDDNSDEADEEEEERSEEVDEEEETLERSDTKTNNEEEKDVDPLSSYQYYKLKTLGHLFPNSDNDGSEDDDEEEKSEKESTLHSQQQKKMSYRDDAAAKDDDKNDNNVEEEEGDVSSKSSFDGDDDYRKEKEDEETSQQTEGLSDAAAADNDDNNFQNDDKEEEVVPLTTKEYFKLKELGHLFPSSESSEDDDDSEAESDKERSVKLHLQSQQQEEDVNNYDSDGDAPAVDDDDDDDDNEEVDPLRTEEYFKLKDIGHSFPQSSSDDDDDDDDDDDNQDSDDDDDLPIKQQLQQQQQRKRGTITNQTQSVAEQKRKICNDVPKNPSPNRRVLRSSTNNNGKRKRDGSLLFSTTATKKRAKHMIGDDDEGDSIDDDDVGGSTTHEDDSSSDEGNDDDQSYPGNEEKDDIDEEDDSDNDESFDDEEEYVASSVQTRKRAAASASATRKKKTNQTQKKRRRRRRTKKKKSPQAKYVDIVWNERLMELKDYHDEYGTWQVDEKNDISLAKWTHKLRRRYLAFVQQQQEQEQTNASENETMNEDQQEQQQGNDNENENEIINNQKTTTTPKTATATSNKTKVNKTKEILSLEQYEQLCEMGYEYTCHRREVDDQIWKERYDEVYDHYQQYRNWAPPNAKLKQWIKVQKRLYRNKILNKSRQTLRDDRHIQLLHIGFPFPTIDVEAIQAGGTEISHFEQRWTNNLNALVDYHNQHGTWDVDPTYNYDLKEWERRLRVQYKNRIQSQTNPNHKCRHRDILTDERYERLQGVGYEFPPVVEGGQTNNVKLRKCRGERKWNTLLNKTWEERVMELLEYYEEYGTWNVSHGLNQNLYQWERHVRQQYRNRIRYSSNSTMKHNSQQQQQQQDQNDDDDSQNSNNDEDEEDEALSPATNNQHRKRQRRKKKIPILSDERYEQLCQIGYEFPEVRRIASSNQTKSDTFDSFVDLYVEYKSKYDLLPSKCYRKFNSAATKWCVDRHIDNGKYAKLAKWMLRQRRAYMYRIDRQYQRGLFSTKGKESIRTIPPPLSDERYQKLCNVGFIFPDLHFMDYFSLKNNNNDKHPDESSSDDEESDD